MDASILSPLQRHQLYWRGEQLLQAHALQGQQLAMQGLKKHQLYLLRPCWLNPLCLWSVFYRTCQLSGAKAAAAGGAQVGVLCVTESPTPHGRPQISTVSTVFDF